MSASPLSAFARPVAKIDFVTVMLPHPEDIDIAAVRALQEDLRGTLAHPKKQRLGEELFTIHDPHPNDLRGLIEAFPMAKITALEVAIDFHLADGTNDKDRLRALHGWLKHRVFPEHHPMMRKCSMRKYYDARTGQIVRDTMRTKSGDESVYWQNTSRWEQVRLYIKTEDGNDTEFDRHCVRIEATLFSGGCQRAGIDRVARFPQFAESLRRHLSGFLYVAGGIKPQTPRSRTKTPQRTAEAARKAEKESRKVLRYWDQYGASWVAGKTARKQGYRTIPDAPTNRLIGQALKRLRERLNRAELPQKRAHFPSYET